MVHFANPPSLFARIRPHHASDAFKDRLNFYTIKLVEFIKG